ncbi:hypothetical protein [Solihabitans fulvus]|nr:hypothetical protein [Solihabitans fulvus]
MGRLRLSAALGLAVALGLAATGPRARTGSAFELPVFEPSVFEL